MATADTGRSPLSRLVAARMSRLRTTSLRCHAAIRSRLLASAIPCRLVHIVRPHPKGTKVQAPVGFWILESIEHLPRES